MYKFVLSCAAIATILVNASAQTMSGLATDNATIQPAGPRSGSSGMNYFNIEGSSNGNNASYGVIDFAASDFAFGAGSVAKSLSLTFTESNASWTKPGDLNFYIATDGLSSAIRSQGLKFSDNASSLSPVLIGTGSFDSTGTANNGKKDVYTFDLSGAGQTAVNSVLSSGQTLRFVIIADTATTAATWAGYSNSSASARPSLSVTAEPVPEPMSMLALGAGVVAFVRRRRSK